MQRLLEQMVLQLNEQLYVKDPSSSAIGREIIRESVKLISTEGLDSFTFKKLATVLKSTETTIYRYFKNKHQLMMYLSSWYWSILEWKVVFATANIKDGKMELEKVAEVLTSTFNNESTASLVDEVLLQEIVCEESMKLFSKNWESVAEKKGYYSAYTSLCNRISQIILKADKNYKFPAALASTMIEASQRQFYFTRHLNSLTDVNKSHKASMHFILSLTPLKQYQHG
jgi:hypothetical protein